MDGKTNAVSSGDTPDYVMNGTASITASASSGSGTAYLKATIISDVYICSDKKIKCTSSAVMTSTGTAGCSYYVPLNGDVLKPAFKVMLANPETGIIELPDDYYYAMYVVKTDRYYDLSGATLNIISGEISSALPTSSKAYCSKSGSKMLNFYLVGLAPEPSSSSEPEPK